MRVMQTRDAEGPTPQLWGMRERATADGGDPLCMPYYGHSKGNPSSKWVIIVISNAIRRHRASIVTPPEQLTLLAKNIKLAPAPTQNEKQREDSSNVRDFVSFQALDVILLHKCLDVLFDVGDLGREPGLHLLNHFLHELHMLHLLARLHDTNNRRLLMLANIPLQKEEIEELT